jgi:hypothetical protein
VRRYRRSASRLQSGAPTTRGRHQLDSGGWREADQVYRASGRFRPRRSPDRRAPWCSRYFSCPPVASAPQIPGTMSKANGTPRKYHDWASSCTGTRSREDGDSLEAHPGRGWGFIAAWSAAGIWIYSRA